MQFEAGFARVDITPMLGIFVVGYYKPRYADGVLDPLEINALALACGHDRVLLLSIDHCGVTQEIATDYRKHISEVTGVPMEAIYLSSTHTHTGPILVKNSENDLEQEYYQIVYRKMADAARLAIQDLKPAKMGWGIGHAPNVSFIRRYLMKDGSVRTNPGIDHPDIAEPIGQIDDQVSILRFDQTSGNSLVLVHFANHPDVVGGTKLSADWPGFLRRTVEKTLDNTRCLFFNGAQGDVNHVNVHPRGGYLNDMFLDFDDVLRGYKHAQYIGRVVTAGVLQAFDKVQYVDVSKLKYLQRMIHVPANLPSQDQMAEAHRINDLHNAGKDSELPYEGMMLTTVVARAARMVRLEHGPEAFEMPLSIIAIGDVAMVGIPGEPFSGVGWALKATEGWNLVLPTCNTNAKEGYFPMMDAYEQGGYEAGSSNFKAGVAELLIDEAQQMLRELKES